MSPPIQKRILVTGGCGYIGPSNATDNDVEYSVVVVDSLANSSSESLRRVADISSLQNFTIDHEDAPARTTRAPRLPQSRLLRQARFPGRHRFYEIFRLAASLESAPVSFAL
ncbi:hypothetical protein HJC23_007753 [Cyclotella cryptica]|uniref:3-beta hydroxysteroid dehydrogenase/isomerase domain-containing protein n=1 Tax=Cyclotella cryptica TaxID=29204 RepID=A0ABD3R0E6_9STRA